MPACETYQYNKNISGTGWQGTKNFSQDNDLAAGLPACLVENW